MSNTQLDEREQWLKDWKSGNAVALHRLMEDFKTRGFTAQARKKALILRNKLGITEDDLIQEVYLRLLKRGPSKINEVSHFEALSREILNGDVADLVPKVLREPDSLEQITSAGEGTAKVPRVSEVLRKARSEEATARRKKDSDHSTAARDHARQQVRDALAERLDYLVGYQLGSRRASARFSECIDEVISSIQWRKVSSSTRIESLVMDYINPLLDLVKTRQEDADFHDGIEDGYCLASNLLESCFEDELSFSAITRQLAEAVARHGDTKRVVHVFQLKLAGYNHKEIAEAIDISEDVSKKTLTKVRSYLKDILGR